MIHGQFNQAGASMGVEVAKQEPPVLAEIYSLEKAINYLRENIAILEDRLSSVLQEPPPSTEGLSRDIHGVVKAGFTTVTTIVTADCVGGLLAKP